MIDLGADRCRTSDGLSLHYQWWRPPAPRAVLAFCHGLGDHSGLYPTLTDALPAAGIAVYGVDLRGHGRSPGQRAYIDRWDDYRADVQALRAAVAERHPGLPTFLLGNSMGGLVALDVALRHPDGLRGVIATAPALGDLGVPPLLMAVGRALSRVWPRFSLDVRMDLANLAHDPDTVRGILDDPLFHRRGTARLSTEVVRAIADAHERAPTLAVPLLMLHGGADRMVPPAGSQRFFARVTVADRAYKLYPDAYHALFVDTGHREVLDDLVRWIEARA